MSQAVRAMDFLSSRYQTFLSNAQPVTQTADSTIHRLADRLDPAIALPDRRAAVLSLKGLARDEKYKSEIGQVAFERLLDVVLLGGDAEADPESGKAVIETLGLLCEVVPDEHGKVSKGDVGYRHTDMLLSKPEPLRKLFGLLGQTSFYIRFSSLQLLSQLVQNRAQAVQKHLIDYPDGLPAVISILDEKREVIRNEALLLLQSLAHQNADIQKILAFSGAFEKLLDIVAGEGGVEGGIVVQDCLAVVDAMLRFNSSNQNYFRELSLPPRIPPLLLYPTPPPPPNVPAPQEFSLQFWDEQKLANAGMLVGIISLLTGSKTKAAEPSLRPLEAAGIFRCLVELGLSSNAPAPLKTQALLALPSRPNLAVHITPYLPVPGSNGEEWDRLPEQEALGALVGVALDGEYGGILLAAENDADVGLGKEELELRWAAVGVFDNLVTNDQTARLALVASLTPPPPPPARDPTQPMVPLDPLTPGQHLLSALVDLPTTGKIGRRAATKIQIACALLSALVRGSEKAKGVARMIVPGESKPPAPEADADSDDLPRLVSVLIGNVHLALRERGQNNRRAWDRVIVSLLMALSFWMWDSPPSVRDFFGEGGGLQVLMEPITQTIGMDVLVQGLCAFLLGVCYEFNREPGEITRATLYPILHSRIGTDVFISRMARVREDERFKAVGPDTPVIPAGLGLSEEPQPDEDGEIVGGDVWLDWGFVEFWKGNAYTIQRAISVDPDAAASNASMNEETSELIRSLKETIRAQAGELESLTEQLGRLTKERDELKGAQVQVGEVEKLKKQLEDERVEHTSKIDQMRKEREEERESHASQIAVLTEKVNETTSELDKVRAQKGDSEKEQEDLLVFLEELSAKRKKDKVRMKERGLEVSEDEDADGEGDE
ncbi:Intracellular protein transport protein USO1 [Rhizoctonia solani]|uniref:Intracellular protein transport protein USO1 n=1 Tax=Rhizoctonia solani TaxID=456999 RepID=A0A0K6FM07_9AGAM|nr:Intracellular protein transport protein USO1 [Rhizoctonia solani]